MPTTEEKKPDENIEDTSEKDTQEAPAQADKKEEKKKGERPYYYPRQNITVYAKNKKAADKKAKAAKKESK